MNPGSLRRILFPIIEKAAGQFDFIHPSHKQLFRLAEQEEIIGKITGKLRCPLFVKPVRAGSSIGITRVENEKELPDTGKTRSTPILTPSLWPGSSDNSRNPAAERHL